MLQHLPGRNTAHAVREAKMTRSPPCRPATPLAGLGPSRRAGRARPDHHRHRAADLVRRAHSAGTAKAARRSDSQVKPSPPDVASEPRPSMPTSVQTRKKKMSARPKCFCSLEVSSCAAAVLTSGMSSGSTAPIVMSAPVSSWPQVTSRDQYGRGLFPAHEIVAEMCDRSCRLRAFTHSREYCRLPIPGRLRRRGDLRPSGKNAVTAATSGSSSADRSAPNGAFQNGPVRCVHGPT